MTSETQAVIGIAVSCVALVFSAFSLGWTIYRDVLDKGKLKLTAKVARMVTGTGGNLIFIKSDLFADMVKRGEASDDGKPDLLAVTITNVGRRSIVISQWGGLNPKGAEKAGFVILAQTLPKTLQPGEYTIEWTGGLDVLKTARAIFVSDSTGREWRVRPKDLRKVQSDAGRITKGGVK